MKVLFVGPSLHGFVEAGRLPIAPGIECLPPAAQGDIARAVLGGTRVIGLVDGRYEDVAAPWHKEILFALERGVAVIGGASLGALRAVECEPFGMMGVGRVFERYRSGDLVDDSDVAQCHAPVELGCFPTTEALVNVEATIAAAKTQGELDVRESETLMAVARQIFFKDLSLGSLAARRHKDAASAGRLLTVLMRNRVDIKREDALELVEQMMKAPNALFQRPDGWRLARPAQWTEFINCLSPLDLWTERRPPALFGSARD